MDLDLGWVFEQEHVEPDLNRALALAVILRAIQDASGSVDAGGTAIDQQHAKAFLFAKSGKWAAARRAWTEFAELEPGWLERHLKERGLHENTVPVRRRRSALLTKC